MLRQELAAVLPDEYDLVGANVPSSHRRALEKLQSIVGGPAIQLPQATFLTVHGKDATRHYTLLRNNAHSNITSLLREDKNRVPERDTVTVVSGFLGAYPDAFVRVDEAQLNNYVEAVLALSDAADYQQLMNQYAIRRTNPDFWQHSDAVQASHLGNHPYRAGLFDYNRLENR